MEQASTLIPPKLKPLIDTFTAAIYDMTELEFAEREVNNPFVQNFITGIDSVLSPYKVFIMYLCRYLGIPVLFPS